MSEVERGEHRRSYCMLMSVASFTGVVPLLLVVLHCSYTARMRFKFSGSLGRNGPSLCSEWHAHIIRTHAHTEAPFVAVTKRRKPSSTATVIPWLPQVQELTGVIQAHSSSRQHSEKMDKSKTKKLNGTSVLELSLIHI